MHSAEFPHQHQHLSNEKVCPHITTVDLLLTWTDIPYWPARPAARRKTLLSYPERSATS
ncbi:hypothetical protein BN1200_360012 [Klebsiella variicola]|nr:hypothetical protein BN1200_360012 [Klebsiella variicola]